MSHNDKPTGYSKINLKFVIFELQPKGMDTIEELNAIGSTAVRQLRKKKLENGKPFLFWSNELPKNQSYLEYPDRSIKIVTVSSDLKSFYLVSELT